MDNILLLLTVCSSFAPLIGVFALTPKLARKGSLFGVLVEEEVKERKQIKGVVRHYQVFSVVSGLLLGTAAYGTGRPLFIGICLVAYVLLCLGLYWFSNRLVRAVIIEKDLPNLQKKVYVQQMPSSYQVKALSLWWYLLLLIPIGTCGALAFRYPFAFGYVIPLVQGAVAIGAVIVRVLIVRTSHYVNQENVEESVRHNQWVRRQWCVFSLLAALVIQIGLVVLQLDYLERMEHTVVVTVLPFGMTVAIAALAIFFALHLNKR